ncbi:CrcB family protein [Methanoregula sp.]|uniref:CrcB family protein n=1 Tax=Methanoregula sp. TaxID=2052170 RepID=UPI0035628B6B
MTGNPAPWPDLNLTPWALIGTGGFCGSVLHYTINAVFSTLPGTLIVNTLGSVLMGIFMFESMATGRFSRHARMLIGIGFLGAFTTFSGLALIAVEQPPVVAAVYVAATLLLGLFGILLGRTIVGLHGRR